MKIIQNLSFCLVFTILCISNSYGKEKTASIYSSVSYNTNISLSKHSLEPQIGVGLDFRKNKFIRFDNKLGVIWFQERWRSIKKWKDENGAIVRTDSTENKENNLGLTYSFIPSLILWNKIIIGPGIQIQTGFGFAPNSFSFNLDQNLIAKIGYKFKRVEIDGYLISQRQVGAGLSFYLPSRDKKTTVEQN